MSDSPPAVADDRAVLVTGANGEFGHGLIRRLVEQDGAEIVALDRTDLDPDLASLCRTVVRADITDDEAVAAVFETHPIGRVHHLAALLSTAAERDPERAHAVNVEGTMTLLRHARAAGRRAGAPVRFLFPSSIAVYGLPGREAKAAAGRIDESAWLDPVTMYGCNKLACEHLGRYYARHYRLLESDGGDRADLDFRAIRFPGVISAFTLPTGGTSDYAPEMIHAAARGEPYASFVRADAALPFITMPEAIGALLDLADTDPARLTRTAYNIGGFEPTAGDLREEVLRHFPEAQVTFAPDERRQAIVDTWPSGVVDDAARRDWGWTPTHTLASAFDDYLVPRIRARYATVEPRTG